MKKFMLNLITVCAWIYQVLIVVDLVGIVIFGVLGGIAFSQPGIKKEVFSQFKIANPNFGLIVLILAIFFVVLAITQFFICGYVKKIIKHIKQDIYFDKQNLALLKKMLIAIGIYTVANILMFITFSFVKADFNSIAKVTDQSFIYPFNLTSGLTYLATFYVIYLVFKSGLKLQDDSNSII
ncbi:MULTISPECIES: DUF2975 domain-containing protein [Lactobacillus]|uniref:DUF2975 domain-containing protein n=1 Tax=Lactobacillus xujianguonis TaxID=2495899 RepID=A0A437SVE1_9LACO|nr:MULTISPECIES: DUF2975 domain-containing protein [Lactobacillus]RVU70891.1 DUF2975 domain-containing protein [Lactobacillus xujianguonis]RVU73762.1 DUF2975 domain-containing protein [Lactobacillus xujianguonis]